MRRPSLPTNRIARPPIPKPLRNPFVTIFAECVTYVTPRGEMAIVGPNCSSYPSGAETDGVDSSAAVSHKVESYAASNAKRLGSYKTQQREAKRGLVFQSKCNATEWYAS